MGTHAEGMSRLMDLLFDSDPDLAMLALAKKGINDLNELQQQALAN